MTVIPQILTCEVGHNMALHHNWVSAVSVWALTDGSVNPLPLNSAEPSWSLPSHQKQVIWGERGRRGDGRGEGKRDDSQWHQGVLLSCSKQEAPLYSQPANSNHSSWETAHDWLGASICSEPTDCLPGGKMTMLMFWSVFHYDLNVLKYKEAPYTCLNLMILIGNLEISTETLFITCNVKHYQIFLRQADIWEQGLVMA